MPPKAAAKAGAAAKAKGKAPSAPAKAAGPPAKAGAPAAKAKAAPPKAASPPPKAPTSPAGGGAAAAKALKAEEEAKKQAEAEKEAEEEAKRKAEEEKKEEERKKAEAEAEAKAEAERQRKKAKENGDILLKYSHYNEKLPIKGGKITAKEIDEHFCLSDVMPKCSIHLSLQPPEDKYKMVAEGEVFPYLAEEPVGTFFDLEADETYYVHVDEDEEEFLKSQAKAKQNFAGVKSEATRGEGCSCLEGNPCASECDAQGNTICKDWANRFAVAKANGWIGYQAK
mmetsp:Transcript_147655/g.375104  ORF Transcript_147655/g.375104 Transcript_147655/m.375104 type:complete len:283 (+) Transcript_147655:2-850(+)